MQAHIVDIQLRVADTILKVFQQERFILNNTQVSTLAQFVSNLLNLPQGTNSNMGIELTIDYSTYAETMVVRYDEGTLSLIMDGIERTPMGSDSYEKEYCVLKATDIINDNYDMTMETLEMWVDKMEEFIIDSRAKLTVENISR